MIQPRLFTCSGSAVLPDDDRAAGRRIVALDSVGAGGNVNVQLEDVARVFSKHLPPRLVDLLEIAAYVYTADSATRRGTGWSDEGSTEPWRRDLAFNIPVRDLAFWLRQDINELLVRTLTFLSDDTYAFHFEEARQERALQEYLNVGPDEEWPFYDIERVVLFSGGLDSLAGTVEMASGGHQIALVSHRAVAIVDRRQRELFRQLSERFKGQLIHIPIWVNKAKEHWREHTQRTRSFLFASLAYCVAASLRAKGIRFYENGVVSLNLPVADEVLRARASRTTHPLALEHFGQLFSAVAERAIVVDNPYLLRTKPDVVRVLLDKGCTDLIKATCSCAHTLGKPKTQWHCGTCSQCIDRRVAVVAAGATDADPSDDYVVDVFCGPRQDGYEKNMAVNYARHVEELTRMSPEQMAATFNLELTRAIRYMPDRRKAAVDLLELHRRHAMAARSVFERQLTSSIDSLMAGTLPSSSLLAQIAGRSHITPTWYSFADRITEFLQAGVPKACRTHKPKNESHLQEICDGILVGVNSDLIREYPFMRWSSVLTKPDWSSEFFNLWVELKYIRKQPDIRAATEAIAADITKYGDSAKYVLYVVYDPTHLVDEATFAKPILTRPTMRVAFLR